MKLQNHARLFEYDQAANTSIEIMEKYSSYVDSVELTDLSNELNIWSGLRNEPPQLLSKKEFTEIKLIAGSRVPTFLNRSPKSVDLIFDTGANFSLIIESLADSLQIKILDTQVKVQGILGNEILAKIGISSSMTFGNIQLQNVVLLVFPDSTLYFEKADFQISGIIGFPVISALGEIHRTTGDILTIPAEVSESSYSNLALDYLTPLIEVASEGDSLVLTFDTGAGRTWLFEKYYRSHKEDIDQEYQKTEITLGGVGAVNKYEAFLIEFPFSIGNSSSILDSTIVFDHVFFREQMKYTGNLGQDIIQSFDTMILNFDAMYIQFSNN